MTYSPRALHEIAVNPVNPGSTFWIPNAITTILQDEIYRAIGNNPESYLERFWDRNSRASETQIRAIATAFATIVQNVVDQTYNFPLRVRNCLYRSFAIQENWLGPDSRTVIPRTALTSDQSQMFVEYLQMGSLSREKALDLWSDSRHILGKVFGPHVEIKYLPDIELHVLAHSVEAAEWELPGLIFGTLEVSDLEKAFPIYPLRYVQDHYPMITQVSYWIDSCENHNCPAR